MRVIYIYIYTSTLFNIVKAPAKLEIAAAVGNSSPSKEIDPSLRRSVSGFVRRQRANFHNSTIAGKLVDYSYGTIRAFCLTVLLETMLRELLP